MESAVEIEPDKIPIKIMDRKKGFNISNASLGKATSGSINGLLVK